VLWSTASTKKTSKEYFDLKKSTKEFVLYPTTKREPSIEKLMKIVITHKKLASLFL
jgi:hypothetical protein